MVTGDAKKKTEEKSAIVEKLEKVQGLTHTIKAVGDSVKEVRNLLSDISILFPHFALHLAASRHRGSVDSHGPAYKGSIANLTSKL